MFCDIVTLDIDICLSYMVWSYDLEIEFSFLAENYVCCLLHAVSFEPLLDVSSEVIVPFLKTFTSTACSCSWIMISGVLFFGSDFCFGMW